MSAQGDTKPGPVPLSYYSKAQTVKPPLIANENAFLGDVVSSYVANHSPCIRGVWAVFIALQAT